MKNYKEVCGNKKSVWFEIYSNEGEQFLNWAKDLGCVWSNGKEIEPEKEADYLHFSIHEDGTLTYVDMMTWFLKNPLSENIDKYIFSEYIKGIKVEPKSRMIVSPHN